MEVSKILGTVLAYRPTQLLRKFRTDLGYAATRMGGTDLDYDATSMSSTDLGYDATRMSGTDLGYAARHTEVRR
eukprot:1735430-Rhodomonas_salina.1